MNIEYTTFYNIMKKFFAVIALASICVASYAQEEGLKSVKTNSFWSNWFASVNYLGISSSYSSQESQLDLSKNPMEKFRRNQGVSIALGKWFTPGVALRLKVNGLRGQQVNSDKKNSIDQFVVEADAMWNPINMIWGYKEDRFYNFIPYLGYGLARDCSDNAYGKTYNVGILNTFRLTDRIGLNLEVSYIVADADADGNGKQYTMHKLSSQDRKLGVEAGIYMNLGKNRFKRAYSEEEIAAEYDPQIAALNNQLSDANSEIARLKDELAKKPKEIVRTEVEKVGTSVPHSIFFNCNSAKITSAKETVNLKEIADAAKANSDMKVYITGYADSATGNSSINQTLSEKRAETVASKLEAMGVSRDQMVIASKGGVDIVNPSACNRRVVVEVK